MSAVCQTIFNQITDFIQLSWAFTEISFFNKMCNGTIIFSQLSFSHCHDLHVICINDLYPTSCQKIWESVSYTSSIFNSCHSFSISALAMPKQNSDKEFSTLLKLLAKEVRHRWLTTWCHSSLRIQLRCYWEVADQIRTWIWLAFA